MTEPCDLDAVEARRRIGDKRLSSGDLLESCIARVEAVDPAINAMVTRDFGRAREAAREADDAVAAGRELGALHGLPIGVKDVHPVAGLRTTWGSPLFADHVPDADCRIVADARAAGAIVLGMTNVPEWAAGANTRNPVFGATGNPFDPRLSAAGSSGGSAAALATNMVSLATGSDHGGSLRNPAAFCGVVGFRPSPGLVPDDRNATGFSSLAVGGPMARTVADTAFFLSAIATTDSSDPWNAGRSFGGLEDIDLSSVRAAFSPDFGFAPVEREIADAFAEKTALFRDAFARADNASPDCSGTDDCYPVLRAVEFLAKHIDRVRAHPDKVGPNIVTNVEEGLRYSATDVARAAAMQTAIYCRWQAFFRDHDVLITPSITITPRPWTELAPTQIDGKKLRSYTSWLALAYAVSLVGHPAISLPVGRDHAGMPFGLQIVGRRHGDAAVLAVAAALERRLAGDARTARPIVDFSTLIGVPRMSGLL